jgi:predicted DCC family thiol-disulfide oxidoreductase YuxK
VFRGQNRRAFMVKDFSCLPMKQIKSQGLVLYDDTCGFCRKWVPFWGKTLSKRGFAIGSLENPDVAGRLQLSNEELTQNIRLLLDNGTQIVGPDVYRYVMRRIWWAYPVYLLSILPLLRNIFDWAYRTFARHRHLISKKCGLDHGDSSRNS